MENADDLTALLATLGAKDGVIPAAGVAASGIPKPDLMRRLLPWAAGFADPPISHIYIGAIAEGASGALYAGMNLEWPGQTLAYTVHGEGAATNNAWLHDETGIVSMAVNEVPCGYCRQYLAEFVAPEKLTLLLPGRDPVTLAEGLPWIRKRSADNAPFHAHANLELAETATDPLLEAALAAARRSYAPYSGTRAGVAVQLGDGTIFRGRHAENSAFNPGMPALQSALIAVHLAGRRPDDIVDAALVETGGHASQLAATTNVLATFSAVTLRYAPAA